MSKSIENLRQEAADKRDHYENMEPSDYYTEEDHEDTLNKDDDVVIRGLRYPLGDTLNKIDPIAFREDYNNELDRRVKDNDIEEIRDALRDAEDAEEALEDALDEEDEDE